VVNLRFAGGAIGNVESFMDAKYGYDIRTEVVGTRGTIQIGSIRQTPLVLLTREGSSHDLMTHWLFRFGEAYRREMCDFVENVLHGRPPRVTGEDGRRSLAIAIAAVQSFRERRPIAVEGSLRSHA
jgi:scyllo-inositol 2-dehydrogenase (NAD+)